jgi:hypothetical protein
MPWKTKSSGLLYVLLALQCFSVLKLVRSDTFDRLYGILVLGFGAFCLFAPKLVSKFANKLRAPFPKVHDFISSHSVSILVLCFILNTTKLETGLLLVMVFLLPLAFLENDTEMLRRNFLETSRARFFGILLFSVGAIAFALNMIKTPSSLTEYHHTQYIADELQIQLTDNKAFSSYAAQYSNLLGPILGRFIRGEDPLSLEVSTIWALIVLQYIAVAILLILIVKLAKGAYLKYSLLFTFSMLGGAFFYSQSTLDWLQNFPARTFFPIVAILFYFLRLKFDNSNVNLSRYMVGNFLDILIGGLAALSIGNDPIFGFPFLIAFFLVTILDREIPTPSKVLRLTLVMSSFLLILITVNGLFFHPSELPKDFALFTHYIVQYSSQGFGDSYSFFGPDVVFWSFAIFAIWENRTTNSSLDIKESSINRNLVLLCSLLILSTIPYSTGRSLTPQIWASCAIYLSLLFSLQIQSQPNNRSSAPTGSFRKALISLSILLSLTSGLLVPNNIKYDIQRITGGNPEYSSFSTKLDRVDSELNQLLKVLDYNRSDVGIMLPFGNNLASINKVQNMLMANDPTSIISSQQFSVRCQKFTQFPIKAVVVDASLFPLYNSLDECKKVWKLENVNTEEFRDSFFVLIK